MTIYNYNEVGEFTKESEARENPLEKGKYLIPLYATTKSPIIPNEGEVACYIDNNWTSVKDNRGKTVYSTSTNKELIVDYIGEIREGYTLLIPSDFDEWIDGEWVENQYKKETSLIAQYKSYYQEIFNTKLEELDYDGIDTVTFWASKSGSEYNVEANSLSNWYEAIILKNYEILNAVKAGTRTQPTKEEYLAELPQYSDFV